MLANLEKLVNLLNRSPVDYCVIGGIAILLYGGRASTIDFDFYVLVSQKDELLHLFDSLGIKSRAVGEFQIKAKFHEIPIDILIADEWVGIPALKRAKILKLSQSRVKVASPEDLIIMKTLADRPIDRRDIEELKELFGRKLDSRYIQRRLKLIQKDLEA